MLTQADVISLYERGEGIGRITSIVFNTGRMFTKKKYARAWVEKVIYKHLVGDRK